MAEYTNVQLQLVEENSLVTFSDATVPCNKGYVIHRAGAGVFALRGAASQCFARYRVSFGANIAIPEGGTVGEISLALSYDGEPLPSTTMIVTPAAVEEFFNVYASTYITVPCGCCVTIGVRNTSDQAVNVQNANLIIERVA